MRDVFDLIYSDKRFSYKELLGKDGSVSIHNRNTHVLATEMYEIKTDWSNEIFSYLFCQTEMNLYNLRIQHDFEVPLVKSVYHVSENISFLGPRYGIFFWHQ